MKKNLFGILLIFFCSLILVVSATHKVYAEEKVIMKISASGAGMKATYGNELVNRFKYLAELYSNYEIEVKIYPNGAFGDASEAALAVRNGECHLMNHASNNFAVHAPSMNAFSLPYMFDSYEQAFNFTDGPFGEVIRKKAYEEAGVRLVAFHRGGWRGIANSKRPIHKLEDLKGLKIRVPPSPIYIEMFKAWGVNPVTIGWMETFTSLQQRVADGFENPMGVVGTFKFYEIQKYYTWCKYVAQIAVVILNDEFYTGLSPDHKDAVDLALKETIQWLNGYVDWSDKKWAKICERKGMILYDLPDEEEARWAELARAQWPKLYKMCGGKEWVERFDKAVKQAKK